MSTSSRRGTKGALVTMVTEVSWIGSRGIMDRYHGLVAEISWIGSRGIVDW